VFANMLLGRLAVRDGRAAEGIALLEATAAEMRRVGVDYYADLADALVAEGEAQGGSAPRALARARELLSSANGNLCTLRRVSGIALARIGDRSSARREIELAVTLARERGEQYELALSLDALGALRPLDPAQRHERDAILERLGVVRLPAMLDLGPSAHAERPTAALAGRH
jgi:hypothetical protein